MSRTASQCEKVLGHLRRYGSITPLEAMTEYHIMRLGARIWDLKKQGHEITAETVVKKNADGSRCSFSRYRMRRGGDGDGIPGND